MAKQTKLDKMKSIIELAKASGATEVTIEGTRLVFAQTPPVEAVAKPQVALPAPVQLDDKQLETMFKQYPDDDPINDPELIQYYATPYYDVLLAEREAKQKAIKESRLTREPIKESTNG